VGLGAVLDQRDPRPVDHRFERGEVGGVAVEVDGHDRAGARADQAGDVAGIDLQVIQPGVGEAQARAGGRHAVGGGQRVGGQDDLVAGADAAGAQRQLQRVAARRHADGVRSRRPRGELLLEGLDLAPEHVPAAVQHARGRGEQPLAQLGRLLGQPGRRDARQGRFSAHGTTSAGCRGSRPGRRR
jgi:hypothetical protein